MTGGIGNRKGPHGRRAPVLVVVLLLAVCIVAGAGGEPAGAQESAPPVTSIRVVNGANPGEVIIAWDAEPEAAYYRFGYVNMVTDYPAAKANGNWMEAFVYVDSANRGRTSYTFRRLESGARHAFTVLTNNSRYGEPTWPANPRWKFLTVADEGTGTTPPTTPNRSAPAGLTAVPGPDAGQVSLTWTPADDAALHLVWSVRPDGTGSQWHDAETGSAVVSGLEAGLEYSFAIIAGYASSNGEVSHWSSFSNRVRATARVAPVPENMASAIAAGGGHTCVVQYAYGRVTCWGFDYYGQASSPEGEFQSVSAGSGHTCGVRTNGHLDCWGTDEYGLDSPPEGEFQSVSAGAWHTCGVRMDGVVACWGLDENGQASPPQVEFQSVSAGGDHTCGVRTNGTVTCWGADTDRKATPPEGQFQSVSAGGHHTCGVRTDGHVDCWGNNYRGGASPP